MTIRFVSKQAPSLTGEKRSVSPAYGCSCGMSGDGRAVIEGLPSSGGVAPAFGGYIPSQIIAPPLRDLVSRHPAAGKGRTCLPLDVLADPLAWGHPQKPPVFKRGSYVNLRMSRTIGPLMLKRHRSEETTHVTLRDLRKRLFALDHGDGRRRGARVRLVRVRHPRACADLPALRHSDHRAWSRKWRAHLLLRKLRPRGRRQRTGRSRLTDADLSVIVEIQTSDGDMR